MIQPRSDIYRCTERDSSCGEIREFEQGRIVRTPYHSQACASANGKPITVTTRYKWGA